ncbi:sulfatase [Saccharobesus litoralis]|uniref:Sulfatase n=1 Tax=Saccharobesus litoralis TaxID=2172099 RepID=A0A2S0VPU3_9ALTE|nr:sulfatase [Saccharobesus litoralis]AWB66202.1 sulfatase [Saccharobesus litoralis]
MKNLKNLSCQALCVSGLLASSLLGCTTQNKLPSAETAEIPAPKNVLFVLVDDLGIKDLSVEGSTFYETPNIDQLANKGVRFSQGYAASQVCSPSRASLLTGKYVTNHGVTTWIGDKFGKAWRERGRFDSHDPAPYKHVMDQSEVTLAEQFKSNGYNTFFAGKWHLGGKGSSPEDHGFDINVGGWDTGTPQGGYFSPYKNPKLKDGPNGESLTLRLAQETASYIEKQQGDKPFFAYLSFYAVHAPIQSSQALWQKYRDKAEQQALAKQHPRFEFDRRGVMRQIQDNPIFAGLVESMDNAVGLVLNKLKATGLDKNTIVVFTSDNGGLSSGDGLGTSSLPYRGGKGRQFEGGVRVPYYIYAPGMSANGSTVAMPVSGIDLYPTLLDLAGIKQDANHQLDGISLKPLLQEKTVGQVMANRPLFWHFPHYGNQGGEPSSMIRQGDWKLIYYHEDQRVELYNLVNDIGEQHDLAQQELAMTTSLKAKLDDWLLTTKAVFPQPNPEYDPRLRQAYLDKKRNSIPRLDKRHEAYLDKNFTPNNKWWGSEE